jgi:Protein of unknown function (DUF3489)
MTKAPKRKSAASQTSTVPTAPELAPEPSAARPGGKLGQVVDRLSATGGATIDELMVETGWQRHTVRAALSRLKARGFEARPETRDNRKTYRLNVVEG